MWVSVDADVTGNSVICSVLEDSKLLGLDCIEQYSSSCSNAVRNGPRPSSSGK